MFEAIDIAKYIVCYGLENDVAITNLKLQKLLYYAQAWYLVNFKEPLFGDRIEAWQFGPVIPAVYNEFKKYGKEPIMLEQENCRLDGITTECINFLDEFCERFIAFSTADLVSMTHNEAPWVNAFTSESKLITPEAMLDFYSKI